MRVIEVGPRDGLQNESTPIPTELKVAFIKALQAAGIKEIEATSFVSPKWVPQLADSGDVVKAVTGEISVLVPNMKGLERALELGVKRIALFTAASDQFTKKNINMSVAESLEVFADVANAFRQTVPDGWIRGYVSTAFECPYAGPIAPEKTFDVAMKLMEIGVDEVSIGDTIGVAAPHEVKILTPMLTDEIPADKIAYHFHDTRGTAIANVQAAIDLGITAFDSSAAGLGGCPYAPGAGGNLATEDLVYLLERSGYSTGIDLVSLAKASLPILQELNLSPRSKCQIAVLASELPQTQ
ncbi:MAG: hydroxymethylglutaryl-CoA lyase [Fimbriimonadaceae bacterium]